VKHHRQGFTLIELLIVVVIIGILAAIAIPKYGTTKEKAYLTTMKADLRNLSTAEETYFSDSKVYFDGTSSNDGTGTIVTIGTGWHPSSGVTVTVTATGLGWYASSSYPGGSTRSCVIYLGVTPSAPASNEGEVACDP
jgi:type IV pilus assembly protein PilA